MNIDSFRLFELAAQGFCCSQILILLGLEGMIMDLIQWFNEKYGGRECSAIVGSKLDDGGTYPVKCGSIVTLTYAKVEEILGGRADER